MEPFFARSALQAEFERIFSLFKQAAPAFSESAGGSLSGGAEPAPDLAPDLTPDPAGLAAASAGAPGGRANPEEIIQNLVSKHSSPSHQKRIADELCACGPLEPLLNDESVNEIIVNNQKQIAFEKEGVLRVLPDEFLSPMTFNNTVEKICSEAHLSVHLKKPFAEGKWRNFRVHVIRPPLVPKDFHLILRKHPENAWTFKKLEEKGWAPPEAISLLKSFVSEKHNFLISGGTGSGKTSLLNACLQELPENERVVIIEDADEIRPPNAVSVKLLTQTAPDGSGAFADQELLVKQSLRLRPDRLVMGEVRGAEAKDLLLALSSGHRGSLGTVHAATCRQALWKMEMLTQLGAPKWRSDTVRRLVFSALQGVVVLERRGPLRLLKGIWRVTGLEETGFLFESLYERDS